MAISQRRKGIGKNARGERLAHFLMNSLLQNICKQVLIPKDSK